MQQQPRNRKQQKVTSDMKTVLKFSSVSLAMLILAGCVSTSINENKQNKVSLITLDPGHFHAALVQKTMYPQVSPIVNVYSPEGQDLNEHLNKINGYNTRTNEPTKWKEIVYTGSDFLKKMIAEKKGNVVVISGNNARKTDYIYSSVKGGFNVLSDKPMVITPDKFQTLLQAFDEAEQKGVLLYDIMTERHEITSMLQKELSLIPAVFGNQLLGSPDNPAITKESVHHFFKYVSGKPLKRPAWFFDSTQQGEGLVDVTTHLVDLIQWECFPEQILDYKKDIKMLEARRWTTTLSDKQFTKATGLDKYPDSLGPCVKDGKLVSYCNGKMLYCIKGVHAMVSVIWNFEAPEGTGDTHYSVMKGSRCNLVIRQGKDEGYKPVLYIEANKSQIIGADLSIAIGKTLQTKYPGLTMEAVSDGKWKVIVPAKFQVGHEAHFAQVTEKFLSYLSAGKLPAWEVPNMKAKYFTTTEAARMAK